MKRTVVYCTLLILILQLFLFSSCTQCKAKNAEKIAALEKQIQYLKEEVVPMKFKIDKYDDSKISLKAAFYDINGEKVGLQKIDLDGTELHLNFKIIQFSNDNFLFFPYGFYTNKMSPDDCVTVFDTYDDKGFPSIFNGITEIKDDTNKEPRNKNIITAAIRDKFESVKNNQIDFGDNSHGLSVHDLKDISSFSKGFVYNVVCHPHTGAVEIIME